MKLKLAIITFTILLTAGLATADITFDHSGNIIFDTSTEFNDNVDLNNANLLGFPTQNCPDGEAVTNVNDDGSVQCSEISGGGGEAQNLSEVLDEDNTANQDIDMDGNEIIMLEAISAQDTDIRVDSELNLSNNNITNLESLENFFNSACTADEAVTDIQDDGTLICNEVGSSEGEALNLSQVLEEGNVANQSIEFEKGTVLIGDNTLGADSDVVIGSGASSFDEASGGVSIGAGATDYNGVSLGSNAESDSSRATALGPESEAAGLFSSAIGFKSEATGQESVAIGPTSDFTEAGAFATGTGSVAIGSDAVSDEEYTARFGSGGQPYDVDVTGDLNVEGELTGVDAGGGEALNLSQVLEEGNIANQSIEFSNGIEIGEGTTESPNNNDIAIGNAAGAVGTSGSPSIAIGEGVEAFDAARVSIGGNTDDPGSGGTGGTEIGIDSIAATDATALGLSTEAKGQGSTSLGVNSEASGDSSIAIGDSAGSSEMVEGDIAMGTDALAEGGSIGTSTALGRGAEASGDGTFALGDEANATGELAGSIGGGSMAHGYRSTAVGTLANATTQYNTAVGMYSWTQDDAGTAIGYNSQAQDQFGTALGTETFAEGYSSLAVGGQAVSEGDRSVTLGSISGAANRGVAVGSEANASTQYSVALGQLSSVTGDQPGGMALGRDATAQGSGIAIGENAVSDENRTAVFGGGIYDYDVDVTGDLSVDGHIENEGVRDISYSSGHTAWGSGLDSEEVNRFGAGSDEVIAVDRLDVQLKGGGSDTDFQVVLMDTAGNPVAQAEAGTTQNDVGSTGEGEDLLVEATNSGEADVEASITLSGEVYSTAEVATAD